MERLPIDSQLERISESLLTAQSVVVVSPPGSGKTTRVPPMLSRSLDGLIIMLQPRRVAVRSSVERIAEEQQWDVGGQIGYQIRFDKKWGADSHIVVMTEGVLSKRLQSDPQLHGVSAVVLDEFHERSLHCDFALAWISKLQQTTRKDLKLIVMSATVNAEAVSGYLNNCPVVVSDGELHPLTVENYKFAVPFHDFRKLIEVVSSQVAEAAKALSAAEALLVFLPGVGEIEAVQRRLKELGSRPEIYLLHGRQSVEEQRRSLVARESARIVLATNVAETSLTVSQVSTVIDSGLERVLTYNPRSGVEMLKLQRISRASAEQRAGRAARLGPGKCVRLWTLAEHQKMLEYLPPEIHRVDLTEWMLYLKNMGLKEVEQFPWFTAPKAEFIENGLQVLTLLGMIRSDGQITDKGLLAVKWPLSPRLANILLHSLRCKDLKLGVELAAILSERDFLKGAPQGEQFDASECDLSLRLEIYRARKSWSPHELRVATVRSIEKMASQLTNILKGVDRQQYIGESACSVGELLLLAFPDRLCRRREKNRQKAKMVGGRGVVLDRDSSVKKGELFVAINPMEVGLKFKTESSVTLASKIDPKWVHLYFSDFVKEVSWVEERKGSGAKALKAKLFFDIALEVPRSIGLSPQVRLRTEIDGWKRDIEVMYRKFPAVGQWKARVALLKKWTKEMEWPDYSGDEELEILELLEEEVVEGVDELTEEMVIEAYQMLLPPMMVEFVAQETPLSVKLQSGRTRPIVYAEHCEPYISIKIQELYGVSSNFRIAQGACTVRFELLAPNFKAVQMTSDIGSFWTSGYHEVRRELRIRYSKHFWPEDAANAQPEFKGSYSKRR